MLSGNRIKHKTFITVVFALWFIALQGTAFDRESFLIRDYSVRHGLPVSTVTSILQDKKGYIWIGTQEGFARFDGVTFSVFTKSTVPGIEDDYVFEMLEDSTGNIWFATYGGLTLYQNNRFRTFTSSDGLTDSSVICMCEDSSGAIWVGTYKGISRYKNNTFSPFDAGPHINSHEVENIICDQNDVIWAVTEKGVFSIEHSVVKKYNATNTFDKVRAIVLFSDSEGALWVGTHEGGLVRIFEGSETIFTTKDGLPSNRIWELFQDSKGTLWVGTISGLCRFNGSSFEKINLTKDNDNLIYTIEEDNEGNMWIGTQKGILQLKTRFIFSILKKDGLGGNIIWSVCEDSWNNIWVGTNSDGVTQIDPKIQFKTYTTADGLSNNTINAVFPSSDGRIWIGTNKGLNIWKNGKIQKLDKSLILSEKELLSLFEDSSGTLWAGTQKGLYLLDLKTMEERAPFDILSDSFVSSICETEKGVIWIGTDTDGLFRYENGILKNISESEGLGNLVVTCFYYDPEGTLWIGTYGSGIYRYKHNIFSSISLAGGLPTESVFIILEDNYGYFWMSSNKGITRVKKTELHDYLDGGLKRVNAQLFTETEGMSNRECNGSVQPSAWKSTSGRMLFSTIEGLNIVVPELYTPNSTPPEIMIEKVIADEHEMPLGELIVMDADTDKLAIHYTGISMTAPEKIRFKIRLRGYDEWSDVGSRRVAYYTNLSPGDYVFQVQGFNSDGFPSTHFGEVKITLTPHFYETWLFYFLCLMVVFLTGFGIYRYRLKRLVAHERELMRMVDIRTNDLFEAKQKTDEQAEKLSLINQELKSANKYKTQLIGIVAHDLKNPLQGITGFTDLMRKALKSGKPMEKYIEKIAYSSRRMLKLIEDLLDTAKMETASLSLEKTTFSLKLLIETSVSHASVFCKMKEQVIKMEIEKDESFFGDYNRLEQAIDNVLNNAIKFSPINSEIKVSLKSDSSWLEISIEDEGPGFTAEDMEKIFKKFSKLSAMPTGGESSTGLGLFICKQIIELHGGSVEALNRDTKGAIFKISLPNIQD